MPLTVVSQHALDVSLRCPDVASVQCEHVTIYIFVCGMFVQANVFFNLLLLKVSLNQIPFLMHSFQIERVVLQL